MIFRDEKRLSLIILGAILKYHGNPIEKKCLNVVCFDLDNLPFSVSMVGTSSCPVHPLIPTFQDSLAIFMEHRQLECYARAVLLT